MTFLAPSAAWFLGLLIPLTLLFWWEVRVRRQRVASLLLWERNERTAARWQVWWRWRDRAMWLVQVCLLVMLVAALAEPIGNWTGARTPQRWLVILDNSASMQTRHTQGTRWQIACHQLSARLARIPAGDSVALVTVGSTTRWAQTWSTQPAQWRRSLASLSCTDGPTALRAAWQRLVTTENPTQPIRWLVVTDPSGAAQIDAAERSRAEWLICGEPTSNRAITHFQVRRSWADPLEWNVEMEVSFAGADLAATTVEWSLNGALRDVIPCDPAEGPVWRRTWKVSAMNGGLLEAKIRDKDALPLDDRCVAWLDAQARCPVFWRSGGNLYVRRALEAIPWVDLQVVDEWPANMTSTAVCVTEGDDPTRWPAAPLLSVGAPAASVNSDSQTRLDDVRVARQAENSPWLRHVDLRGVEMTGARQVVLPEDAEILAENELGEPLVWLEERVPRPLIVLNTNPAEGDLAWRTAFPVLITQVLMTLRGRDDDASWTHKSGEIVKLPGRPHGIDTSVAAWGPLDQLGVWRGMPDGRLLREPRETQPMSPTASDELPRFAVNLNDREESSIDLARPADLVDTHSYGVSSALWPWCVGLALCSSLGEWWLYHRRWIGA